PIPLSAVALTALNDHVLKVYFPSMLTGKISDFAGMFFSPLFFGALVLLTLQLVMRKPLRLKVAFLVGFMLSFDYLFIRIKTMPEVAESMGRLLTELGVTSKIVADPTDLIAMALANVATIAYLGWFTRQRSEDK
ncbi:MAG: hypothetical protein AAB250_09105, partial [Bdellovibrionota bacterium]